ncbi:MAG TPA: transcription elongation factor GreA [Firmicutes bacterium]|jgi:transcription elongation factor GreA|nr:transcription elongation factor GreA [Bacillota bacterium]
MLRDKEIVLTIDGLNKLEKELEYLKTVRRREVAQRIKQAIEFGDITDNSEYEDAKNEQGFIEGRILTIEKMLRNARVLNDNDVQTDQVGLGSRVLLKDLESGEKLNYTIVSSAEADPAEDKISNESPVGQALLGKKAGEEVEITVPAGILRYRVEKINK